MKILNQTTGKRKNGSNHYRAYKYLCLCCNNEDIIGEYVLKRGGGCNVCCPTPRKVLKGYNDLWTTHPNIAILLKDKNRGYETTKASTSSENFICPDCGNVINKKMYVVTNNQGLACPKCGDGKSYPEKIMINILTQLNIVFESEYTPEWIKPKRYDFYFGINGKEYILEMDGGLGHGRGVYSLSKQTIEETQAVDDYKDKIAKEHGIEVIRIDCNYNYNDRLNYIKNNIIIKLNDLFDLSNINWSLVEEFALSNLAKKACDLWNNGIKSSSEIGRLLNVSQQTTISYLKKGFEFNWCDYTYENAIKFSREKIRGRHNSRSKKVVCLNNKEIFDTIEDAKNKYSSKNIGACCKNEKRVYSGKLNGEYLQWQYYDEWLLNPKKLLDNDEIDKIISEIKQKSLCKKIINIDTGEIFESISKAKEKYSGGINQCCRGKIKTAGGYHWKYI